MLGSMLAKLLLPILLAAGVAAGLYFAAGDSADVQAEKAKLAGEWRVVSAKEWGKEVEGPAKDDLFARRMTFTADKATFNEPGTYAVAPGESPKRLDVTVTKGGEAGVTYLGIYKLEGDKLTLHLPVRPAFADRRRPVGFDPRPGDPTMLIVFERVKK